MSEEEVMPEEVPAKSGVNKGAVGGVAIAAMLGAAAVGAVVVCAGGYKIYQSQKGANQDKSGNKLYIHVHSGKTLQAADHGGTSDPYCIVTVGYVSVKTKVQKKTINPVWDERLTMGVLDKQLEGGQLEIVVMDKDRIGSDDCIGRVAIPLTDIPRNTQTPKEFKLKLEGGIKKKANNGVIKIYLHMYDGGATDGYKD